MAVEHRENIDLVGGPNWSLWNRDCIIVAHEYDDDQFQLLLTSTPYPGQAGFHIKTFNLYLRWWYDRLKAWIPKIHHGTGVIVQNVKIKRNPKGWFYTRQLTDLIAMYETLGLYVIDLYIWDKLNSPPAGNHQRHDRDEYEFVYTLARSEAYIFNEYREPYAEKTIGKAKKGNKMRQADVRGSHAGGHSNLHPDGARQSNVLRISSSGDQGRPRVEGGVFPRSFAERMILTFSDPGHWVVDPFAGSGTTMVMALKNGRCAVGCENKRVAWQTAFDWIMQTEDEI